MKERFGALVRFLFATHVTGLGLFMLYRIVLLMSQLKQLSTFPSGQLLLPKAFLMGLRFDNVIACYITLLPLVVLAVLCFVKKIPRIVLQATVVYIGAATVVASFLSAASVPYFAEFGKHINASVFNWLGDGKFVLGMIFHNPAYYLYFILFLGIGTAYIIALRSIAKANIYRLSDKKLTSFSVRSFTLYPFVLLLMCTLCFWGIRGRLSKKSPIRVGTAFFSNHAFPNQLGLNATFVFLRSWLDMQNESNKVLDLIDDKLALKTVLAHLGITDTTKYASPIARYIETTGNPLKANVVIVLMEGMSAHYMHRYGHPKELTPFLDSLSNHSLCFDNFFSDGIHTMNGVYATLWGYPSILTRHPLDQTDIPQFMGLPNTLSEKGYKTIYFTTHDEQFDNIGGFFSSNGIQQIVSQKDYPSDKVVSALGVPDDYMFSFSMPYLNNIHASKKNFLAVYLTASNHAPIVVPSYFTTSLTNKKERVIAYSDWALHHFLETARKQSWYNNTIFIFLADHGNFVDGNVYDMPITYNHIPFMVYSEKLVTPRVCKNFSGQIDVFPIVMGLLNESYTNNTFGINTVAIKRPMMYFSADDKLGCINDSLFSVDRINSNQSLYRYRENATTDIAAENTELANTMKDFTRSMVQSSQLMLSQKKTKLLVH